MAAALGRRGVDLPVVRQRLPADAEDRALRDPEPRRHRVPAALGGARHGAVRRAQQRHDGLPPHRRRARQPQLPEHPAAAAVPDPVRERERLRQQRRRRSVPRDLGHALADAGRAAAVRDPLELARRRQQRRRERQPLRRARERRRAGVPRRRDRREGGVGDHAGGRDRRPLRQRRADGLVGPRRRPRAGSSSATPAAASARRT